jgi:hypothetical protein
VVVRGFFFKRFRAVLLPLEMAQGGLMRPYLPAASHRLSQLKCSSAASLLSQRALTAMPRAKDAVAPR